MVNEPFTVPDLLIVWVVGVSEPSTYIDTSFVPLPVIVNGISIVSVFL